MRTLINGGNFNCGPHGGVNINQGTFGLVVSVEQDKIVWEGLQSSGWQPWNSQLQMIEASLLCCTSRIPLDSG